MTEAIEQEEILGKAYDLGLIRRLWQFIIPYKRLFILSLLLLPLQQAFGLAQPYLMKVGIDRYIASKDLWGLQNVMLLFLAALIGETITVFAQYYFSMLVAQRCLADLRVAIFSHVQKLPTSYFDRNPVGRLVTRMTTDVDVLQEMFAAGVITLASDFVMVIWIVGIMFYLDIELALVSLALIPPMALAINFFRVKARRTYRQIRVRIARINAYLGEAISGMAVIQLFAREQKTYREFEALNADHRDAYHLSNLYEAGLYSMVEAAGSVSVGLLLWYGGGEVLQGITQAAERFDTQAKALSSAASSIDVSNKRTVEVMDDRREAFDSVINQMDSKVGDLDSRLKRFSALMQETFEAAEGRARDIARVCRVGDLPVE